jgi:hypothetical protein
VVLGQPDFTTKTTNTGGLSASSLYFPHSLLVVGGKLLVMDGNNNRVLVWNSIPTTNFAAADVVIGQPNFTTGSAGTTASKLSLSVRGGMTMVGSRLYLADDYNQRILYWNALPTVSNTAADGVIGQANFTSSTLGCTAQKFYQPYDITTSGTNLILVDGQNWRVLIWNTAPTSNTDADVVIGQPNFTSNTRPSDSLRDMSTPSAVEVIAGKLYVSDFYSSRILVWNSIPNSNYTSADTVLGPFDTSSMSPILVTIEF